MQKSKYVHEHRLSNGKTLLVHTLTFDYVVLDSDEHVLWTKDITLLGDKITEHLRRRKYVFDGPEGDRELLNEAIRHFDIKYENYRPTIYVYITNDCNLRCKYCFEKKERKDNPILDITRDHIDKIMDVLEVIRRNCDPKFKVHITLFGGEPLLPRNKDVVWYFYQQLENRLENTSTQISTNGVFLDHYFDLLQRFRKEVGSVKITFNGPSYMHDEITGDGSRTYERLIRNTKAFLDKFDDIGYSINTLCTKRNVSVMPELYSELEAHGILEHENCKTYFGRIDFRSDPETDQYEDKLELADYYPELTKAVKEIYRLNDDYLIGGERSILFEMYRCWKYGKKPVVPKLNGCVAVRYGSYSFYPDGYIYPCCEIAGDRRYVIGRYIPDFEIFDDHKKWLVYSPKTLRKCSVCKYIAICNGGCPVTNLQVNGDINDVYCHDTADILDNYLRYMDEEGIFAK